MLDTFVRDVEHLKNSREIPLPIGKVIQKDNSISPSHFHVPQYDRSRVFIPTFEVNEELKMLGNFSVRQATGPSIFCR